MSFSSDYLELRKKKKKTEEETKTTGHSFTDEFLSLQAESTKKNNTVPTPTVPVTAPLFSRFRMDDIAPVLTKTDKEEEEEEGWFQKGALDDGITVGSVAKAILGTVTDVGENLGAGIMGMGEKALDALAYVGGAMNRNTMMQAAENEMIYNTLSGNKEKSESVLDRYMSTQKEVEKGTAEFIAKDLYDEEKVAKAIISAPIKNLTGIDAETDSVFGKKTDSLVQSAGQLAATAGLQAVGVPWFVTTGLTTFGGETENAFNQGATYEEAGLSAAVSTGAEILTEKISGGIKFGSNTLDDALTREIARKISNRTVRTLAKLGLDMVGEGSEEVLSGAMSAIGQKISYADDKELEELFSSEDAFESFVGGAVLGGVSGGIRAVKTKDVDYASGLTKNEQAVVDKVYKDRVAEAEESGKISEKEKSKIYDDVLSDMEKGYISTDTIEDVLGDRSSFDSLQKEAEEYDTLYNTASGQLSKAQQDRLAELETKNKENSYKDALKTAKDQYSQSVFDLVKSDRLSESYNERSKRSQTFEADLTQYDAKQRQTIQKAVDSGILNNTRRTHEFVDMIAKISADKGVLFDFTNNTKLKESGFAVDGKTVNGYVTKDGVTLNIDSKKSLNSVVGHEITHVLEGTELYDAMKQTVFEYAKSKGEYDSRFKALTETYKDMDADVEAELAADLVGDYLFTDSDFINRLSTEHRNVFQKIYDEVKYLCKVVTAGSKEARELEKVKKAFEDAYRAGSKESGDTKYSLGYHAGDLGKAESYAEQGGSRSTGHFGTGTYFVGDESKINDGTYGKRPHHSVEFDNYNLYKVKNDKDGYRLHDYLHALDSGVSQEFLDAAISGEFNASSLRSDAFKLAEQYETKEWDEELEMEISKDYFDASIRAMSEVAKANDVEFQSYDEWLAEQSDDVPKPGDSDYDFYQDEYYDYLKELLNETDKERNRGYSKFRDAHWELRWMFGEDKVNRALQAVVDHQAAMEKAGYKDQYRQDSRATVFMKALGYEGIDVRGTGLDNTTYGSVIYDLKGEDLARKKEIGTAKFSLSDSDGKQLSKEQQEYFKDSKMRDENGNLKVMYHGSQDAGFHVFDPKMSDDDTSFFFVDRNDVAASYSGTTETYEAKTIRTAEDMNNFLAEIGHDEDYSVVEKDGKFELLYDGERVAGSDTAQGIYKEFCWYEGVGEGDANYKVYLNLKNPLEVDAEGRNWSNVGKEFSQEVYDKYQTLTEEEKAAFVDLAEWEDYDLFRSEIHRALEEAESGSEDENYRTIVNAYWKVGAGSISTLYDMASGNFTDEAIRENALKKLSTRDYAQKAKAEGYDGVIFKNIVDNGGYSNGDEGASTVAIAFDSSQIKSTANESPTEHKDIRYSLSEESDRVFYTPRGVEVVQNPTSAEYRQMREEIYKDYPWLRGTGEAILRHTYDESGNEYYWNAFDGMHRDVEPYINKQYNTRTSQQWEWWTRPDKDDYPADYSQFRSLSDGEQTKRYGRYNVSGKDIALETAKTEQNVPKAEDVAPVTEEANANPNTNATQNANPNATVTQEEMQELFPDDLAPTQTELDTLLKEKEALESRMLDMANSEDFTEFDAVTDRYGEVMTRIGELEKEVSATESDRVNSLNDADAPPEMEAPIASESVTVDDPFYDREYSEVGKDRKTKAYMYENPEVKPYFQEAASIMLWDFQDSTRGERWYNDELYYESGGEKGFGGVKRHTSKDIEELLDSWGMSYDDIEKGLKAIIEDNGAENIAAAKHIEFMLNRRLLHGYEDFHTGQHVPANQGYIDTLNEIQSNQHAREEFENFLPMADAYAPPATEEAVPENVAPVAEEAPVVTAPMAEDANGQQAMYKEAFRSEAIRPKPQKEPRMARATPEEQATAEILTEEPKVEKKKRNLWTWAKEHILDSGMVFEDLALESGNRELQARWNSIRYSESKAQRLMGKGTDGVKSLNAIREEVEKTGKTKQFYSYLYHKHNVDRMTLETRYKDTPNKPVFGSSVTAEESQKVVDMYEAKFPAFKNYAKDVYDYMGHLRQQLVDNGVISSETAKLWAEMYPNYVPIRRLGDEGLNINVPLDTGRTGVNAPVKRAKGGNRDILPLFDTMGQRTIQTYKAIAKNRFGVELKNTLGTTIANEETSVDDTIDSIDAHDGLLQKGDKHNLPTFTVFENGEKVTFEITDEMYDAMKPASDVLSSTSKTLNTISNIRRGTLTEYNPWFMLKNAVKDIQDVLINSQHAAKTYAAVPKAINQMRKNGHWYQEYMDNGGDQNSYFDSQENTFKPENTALEKAKKVFGLNAISKANNIIERLPRLAEYIASRESGQSVDVAMLDAARVTTNFAAGGDLTKFLNRNGVTFLNASVQGAVQQARNIREAKVNGLKGWANLAAKYVAAGLPAMLLNHLIWEDDEEYEELSDYVKQNYYIVGKYGDGQFVRIPKGRTVAGIQNGFEQMKNLITGNDEADLSTFLDLVVTNLAPNNPLDNNIISPVVDVVTNEAWYGGDLVPTRLQDLPAAEQYDESTDAISRWLGETFNVSPYKTNYLLDQYSGVVGDTFLPMLTPEAESGDNSFLGNMIAPLKDMFTTDSVMNNQNVSDFYDLKDELAVIANGSGATDEDILMSKYLNSVSGELSKLYSEKREVQNSDLSDEEKYAAVREIQEQIVSITKEGLGNYEDISFEDEYRGGGEYARVGDRLYKLSKDGQWQKLSDEQATKYEVTSAAGDSSYATDGSNHYRWYVPGEDAAADAEPEWRKITDDQLEKQEEVTSGLGISPEEYWGNKEEYDYAYEYPESYAVSKAVGGYNAYRTYSSELYDIKADKDENGKSISGSRKEKVHEYIFGLDAEYGEQIILFKNEYNADDTYNYEIIDYLNGREDISYEEMETILKKLGFTVNADGTIEW